MGDVFLFLGGFSVCFMGFWGGSGCLCLMCFEIGF